MDLHILSDPVKDFWKCLISIYKSEIWYGGQLSNFVVVVDMQVV